jgi:integral membrane protein (TIGR03766 family)
MIRHKLLTGAAYVTYGYLFVVFFTVLLFNVPGVYVFSIPKQVFCFIVGECLFIGTAFFLRKRLHTNRILQQFVVHDRTFVIRLLCLLFVLQVLFVSLFYTNTGYDGFFVYRAGTGIGEMFEGLDYYFSNYPNNFLILFLTYGVHQLNLFFGGLIDTHLLLVMINIVCIDVALYLIYAIAKKLFSQKIAAYALLLGVLLLGFMPWLTSVYSDTLSLPIGLLVYYLYLKLKDEKNVRVQIVYAFAIGCFLYIGYLIKPSAIFSGIAIVVIELFCCDYKRLMRQTKKLVLIFCVGTSVALGINAVRLPYNYLVEQQRIVPYDASENFPFTHWMMMGLSETIFRGNFAYGMWNMPDYRLTKDTVGKEAKRAKNITALHERLQSLGIFGYARFVWLKSLWILGDGTFFWGHEGAMVPPTLEPSIRQFVQNVVYGNQYATGRYYGYYVYVLQTAWFIVFSALAFALFRVKKYANKQFFIISCTILGSIVFILLFEGRSRYLLNNLGFYIIIASLGLDQMIDFIKKSKK